MARRGQPDLFGQLPPAPAASQQPAVQWSYTTPGMLWLGGAELRQITELVARSRAWVLPLPVFLERRGLAGQGETWPLDREFTATLPFGFSVTYRVEETPAGLERHLILRTREPGQPPPDAVQARLVREFGFRGERLADVTRVLEQRRDGRIAVHLCELLEPAAEPLLIEPEVDETAEADDDGAA